MHQQLQSTFTSRSLPSCLNWSYLKPTNHAINPTTKSISRDFAQISQIKQKYLHQHILIFFFVSVREREKEKNQREKGNRNCESSERERTLEGRRLVQIQSRMGRASSYWKGHSKLSGSNPSASSNPNSPNNEHSLAPLISLTMRVECRWNDSDFRLPISFYPLRSTFWTNKEMEEVGFKIQMEEENTVCLVRLCRPFPLTYFWTQSKSLKLFFI